MSDDSSATAQTAGSHRSPPQQRPQSLGRRIEVITGGLLGRCGVSGFDGGRLNPLSDAKILIATPKGEYELVEGIHAVVLHIFTKYFKDYFGYIHHRTKRAAQMPAPAANAVVIVN